MFVYLTNSVYTDNASFPENIYNLFIYDEGAAKHYSYYCHLNSEENSSLNAPGIENRLIFQGFNQADI